MVGCLHAYTVHKPFACNFVVGKENIVQILNNVLGVAHRMAFCHVLEPDHFPMGTAVYRNSGHEALHALLSTTLPLVGSRKGTMHLPFFQVVVKIVVECHRRPIALYS